MVRLRFAPSPTGNLHVGGLRTALFCWIFARKMNGKFIFRLEDTDQKRAIKGSENDLIQMLNWAGIDIDEGPSVGGKLGPYRQSERLNIYMKYIQKLIDENLAYRCFCSRERLEILRDEQRLKGETPRYDNYCRDIRKDDSHLRFSSGEMNVVRMKIPQKPETIILNDLIRGKVSIETSELEDQVLLKSDGFPTYHLASVVDDHLMKITHVVRGEEWLPSFPKHLLLYRYFGWEPPHYAHLPLILNPDRSKLSKRQVDVSVEDFKNQGYLPEALINFITFLGWSSENNKELLTISELVDEFSFKRVNKSGSIFDRGKLNWINQQYIQNLDLEDLKNRLVPFLTNTSYDGLDKVFFKKILGIIQPRLITLNEIVRHINFFVDETPETKNPEVLSVLSKESSKIVLAEFIKQLDCQESLTKQNLGIVVNKVQKKTNIKGKNLWVPLRYAITLEVEGPDLNLIVDLFGKEKCMRMVKRALEM